MIETSINELYSPLLNRSDTFSHHPVLNKKLEVNFHHIDHGEEICKLINEANIEDNDNGFYIEKAEELLEEAEINFRENKQKRWIYAVLGFILFGTLTWVGSFTLYEIDHSYYDRRPYDHLLTASFGDYGVKDAITDDVFLISYSYNFRIPRFYTKYFALNSSYARDYDVPMDFASQATSATPLIFDPVSRYTFFNKKREEELLIDGNVIANNPSLYAAVYAREHRQKDKVRVVSLGFKPNLEDPKKNFTYMNPLGWVERLDEIIIDAEVTSHDWLTSKITHDYYRFDYFTSINSYDANEESVQQLEAHGENLIRNRRADIEAAIRSIIDERYGK